MKGMPATRIHGLLKAAALTACTLLSSHAPAGPISEWQVPWQEGRPRDPYVDSTGKVWFCGQGGGYLARFDPLSGRFKRYDLGAERGPHNLIIDAGDQVWYAGNTTGHIGRLDPATGAITRFPMPDPDVRDPHTLVWDRSGNIWFTAQFSNAVGHLDVGTGTIRLAKVPTPSARPYGIVMAPDDRPWIVLFGTNKLATVDPASMTLTEIELPDSESRPRRLEITSDGIVWYGDYSRGMLGRYAPGDGSFREWPLPGGARSWPYGMALDDRDRIWIAETGLAPNRVVAFDPAAGKFFFDEPVPSGGGTLRHMVFDAKSRTVWFGADTNTIGSISVP